MNRYLFTTSSAGETEALGERVGALLRPGDVIAFEGCLGSGKTTFTIGLAKGLGISDRVSSPTFALAHEYRGDPPLCHFDFYRIAGADDLYSSGFFDYLDGRRVLAVEWSEKVPEAFPPGTTRIRLETEDAGRRRITIWGDERFEALGS